MHTRTQLKTLAGSALAAATILAGATGASAATGSPASGNGPATTNPGRTAGPRPTTAAASCDTDAHWPAYVQGRPDGFDAGDDGAYMWHNPKGGWGLRVTHPVLPGKADHVVFSGSVTTAGRITHLVRVRNEKNDVVRVTNNGHTLQFRFVNYGGVDGVDFTTSCTPGLRVDARADGKAMPTPFIHLGDHDAHPGSDPFLIRRRDNDTGTTAPSSGGTGGTAGAPAAGSTGSGSTGTSSTGSGSTGSGSTGAGGSAS